MMFSKLIKNKLNKGNIPIFLELYGDDDVILKNQYDRYITLIDSFVEIYSDQEFALFSSPGRTEIGGNHTDHNHGCVLAGAVNLDNIAAAAKNNRGVISIFSKGYPIFEVNLDDLSVKECELFTSVALVRGIVARFKELGFIVGGFDVVIDGAVPKGSGLSSSASFEILIGSIISHLFNCGRVDPVINALVGQYAENHYFGKPCGLMDQIACAVGGLITIDFGVPSNPVVKRVDYDFRDSGCALVITNTGGNHADLNGEYAALPQEMKSVAKELGASVLRELSLSEIIEKIPFLRARTGDRSILRAIHFQEENKRVGDQVAALERKDLTQFLKYVVDSGHSSFMYNQNIYPSNHISEQGVSLALALSEHILKDRGAWRVHGGGFAGTIQAFVPLDLLAVYVETLEPIFGEKSCQTMFIRCLGVTKVDI